MTRQNVWVRCDGCGLVGFIERVDLDTEDQLCRAQPRGYLREINS